MPDVNKYNSHHIFEAFKNNSPPNNSRRRQRGGCRRVVVPRVQVGVGGEWSGREEQSAEA